MFGLGPVLDVVLFAVFPYLAVAVAVLGSLYRYYHDRYSYSSQSSQFLENRALFWASAPWHYGISLILLAHLLAALVPGLWAGLMAAQVRLYILEATGLALAVLTAVGLVLLIRRRLSSPRIKVVTSTMDWVLLVALLLQVGLGIWVALVYRWGAVWYLYTVVPWLGSLLTLSPQIGYVAGLPDIVKLHILGGLSLITLFPFTRLVHVLTVPVTYLWRPYQVVIWNRRTPSM